MTRDTFTIRPFPPGRRFLADGMDFGERRHCIHGLIEVDVTVPRQRIREFKERTGEDISFTAFIAYCTARVVDADKAVQAYRGRRNRLYLFDDVDVFIPVERRQGEHFTQAVIRGANRKSVRAITEEIRQTQHGPQPAGDGGRFFRRYLGFPRFLRRYFFTYMYGNPVRLKKYLGTVMVTSVGMFGNGPGWGIAPTGHALTVTIGGIANRPCEVDGRIGQREHLCITVSFDHEVVDGAPAARFLQHFKGLLECGSGLPEA